MTGLTIKTDKRFKLNQYKIDKMRKLRLEKMTLKELSLLFKVSTATVQYWTNSVSREKQRKKNALHKPDNKRRVELKKESYKNFTRENTVGYIARYVQNVKYRPKEKQYKLFGLDCEYWENIIDQEKTGLRKIK